MKFGRNLWLILGGIIVVLAIAAGILYFANSRQVSKHSQLVSDTSKAQLTLNKSNEEKTLLESQTPQLDTQLTEAKASLASVGFLSSSESIEYDTILFSLADANTLHVTSLSASPPVDKEENKIKYQAATFTINVEGVVPSALPQTGAASKQYIDATVNNILAFVNAIVTGNDFKTAIINSVSIIAPEPLTDAEVAQLSLTLQDEIKSQLTDEEKKDKTEAQIAQLVSVKLAAMTPEEIQLFLEQTGFAKPSATITFEIWTYKGE